MRAAKVSDRPTVRRWPQLGPVAQLARALPRHGRGRWFESSRVHSTPPCPSPRRARIAVQGWIRGSRPTAAPCRSPQADADVVPLPPKRTSSAVSSAPSWSATRVTGSRPSPPSGCCSTTPARTCWRRCSGSPRACPTFVMAPIAGPVVDRFDRRTVLVVASFAQAAVALLFLLAGAGLPWMVFVAQGGITAIGSFFGPASQAGVANLVDEEDLPDRHRDDVGHVGRHARRGAALGRGRHRRCSAATSPSSSTPSASCSPGCWCSRSARRCRPTAQPGGHDRAHATRCKDTAEALRYARRHPSILALLGSHVGLRPRAPASSACSPCSPTSGATPATAAPACCSPPGGSACCSARS